MLGKHLIKSWSSTQSLVSLSSGEAEYYGVVKASGVGLGYQSLMADLGLRLPLRAWTDSTASIGVCSRSGLGKLRHLDTQCLWLQHKVRNKAVELRKVKGTENPADLFTKHLTSQPCVQSLLRLFGCEYRSGRPEGAPELREGSGTQAGSQLLAVDAARAAHAEIAKKGFDLGRAHDSRVKELMQVNGYDFPMETVDGQAVPEAWSYDQLLLPHLQPEMDRLFPRAVAAPSAGDEDPPSRTLMGEAWARDAEYLGQPMEDGGYAPDTVDAPDTVAATCDATAVRLMTGRPAGACQACHFPDTCFVETLFLEQPILKSHHKALGDHQSASIPLVIQSEGRVKIQHVFGPSAMVIRARSRVNILIMQS